MTWRHYKTYPKGDARRCFAVLLAVVRLNERATAHYIAQDVTCTRAEVIRALEAAKTQFGVCIQKTGSLYAITSWGVLSHSEVESFMVSVR